METKNSKKDIKSTNKDNKLIRKLIVDAAFKRLNDDFIKEQEEEKVLFKKISN